MLIKKILLRTVIDKMQLVPIDEKDIVNPLRLMNPTVITDYYRNSNDEIIAMVKSTYTNSIIEYKQDHQMNWIPVSTASDKDRFISMHKKIRKLSGALKRIKRASYV